MRKSIIGDELSEEHAEWLDLAAIAAIEVTSEDAAHPIEAALAASGVGGWRAATPGEQVVRVRFDQPQRLRRIYVEIDEPRVERTQELLLSWGGESGPMNEIVRQQYNFSPSGSTRERESYHVTLDAVRVLELRLKADLGGDAIASLSRLRVA